MKLKTFVLGTVLLLLITSIPNNFAHSSPISNGNILYVGGSGSGNYSKIQDAIDNSSDGDTVFVFDDSSPYYENVVVDKSINLIGEDKDSTVIDGNGSGDVVTINTYVVSIIEFTIRNGGSSGVKINSFDCLIQFCIIRNNSMSGLYMKYSGDNMILNCFFLSNSYGIVFECGSRNRIISNTIQYNSYGIYFEYVTEWNDGNMIKHNNISYNGVGICIEPAMHNSNEITFNEIFNNDRRGVALIISYFGPDHNHVHHNNFISNNCGNVQADEWPIPIDENSSNLWYSEYDMGGNYWSDYTGIDNDGNGIGDVPYIIDGYYTRNRDIYPMMNPYNLTVPRLPVISHVILTASEPLDTNAPFGWENITCTITDNLAVANIKFVVTNPDTTIVEYPMFNIPETIIYYYNTTFTQPGSYSYHIWIDDVTGKKITTTPEQFMLPPNWEMNNDRKCDISDLRKVALHFGETGTAGWIRADYTNDGECDISDLRKVALHFGETY